MEPLVIVKNVTKSYTRGNIKLCVLQEFNLSIKEGDFFALMGPSGSGKTTLLNMIAGIDKPDRGSIIISGIDITQLGEAKLSRWRARFVGFIFQFYNLIPVLTAYENVILPLSLTNLSGREKHQHVIAALKLVGLDKRMRHYPRQLSGGEEQRVAIARAIVTDPVLLVADEPTGDLDKRSAEDVLNLLEQLNHEFKKTIIMVTHDPRAAEKAHTVQQLQKGELIECP
jgi:putative ABC transport system ATP-binding protein